MNDPWVTFWTFVLISTVSVYSCLAVAVAIGGYFDIRALLRTMDRQHERPDEDEAE